MTDIDLPFILSTTNDDNDDNNDENYDNRYSDPDSNAWTKMPTNISGYQTLQIRKEYCWMRNRQIQAVFISLKNSN